MSRRGGQQPQDRRQPAALLEAVRGSVAGHPPDDAREDESRRRILDGLDHLPRPFDEDADHVHVTGSAVVVGRRGTVLHRHKRLHRWMQPGGHIDPGETPWDAALRESQEETGLAVRHPAEGPRLIHVDVHEAAAGHTHLDLRYLLLAPDEDPAPPPGESPEARWYTWDEAREVADEALAGALAVARRQPEARELAGPDGDGGGPRSDVGRGGEEKR